MAPKLSLLHGLSETGQSSSDPFQKDPINLGTERKSWCHVEGDTSQLVDT